LFFDFNCVAVDDGANVELYRLFADTDNLFRHHFFISEIPEQRRLQGKTEDY
jgi:hypothetical protein